MTDLFKNSLLKRIHAGAGDLSDAADGVARVVFAPELARWRSTDMTWGCARPRQGAIENFMPTNGQIGRKRSKLDGKRLEIQTY
jgi:hypothetical protein